MPLVLVGLYRYAIAQAERGVFLSRFLSPQVSEMVRLQGLASVMQPREIDLTVVCCDLRGFTAYAEAVPSHGTNGLEPRGTMQLKGLSHKVAVFAVPGSQV